MAFSVAAPAFGTYPFLDQQKPLHNSAVFKSVSLHLLTTAGIDTSMSRFGVVSMRLVARFP